MILGGDTARDPMLQVGVGWWLRHAGGALLVAPIIPVPQATNPRT